MKFAPLPPDILPAVFALAVLGASLVAGSVWAQAEPVADASAVIAQPQTTTAQSDQVDAQIAAWTKTPDAAAADGVNKAGIVEIQPRQIHGEAGVSFGSNGYRAGYIATDIPIGKDSDLGIAVGESQFKPKHYGTQTNKFLAISLNIGGGDLGGGVNCRSPTIAMDGRYLEPMWVSHMRGEALARDQMACDGPPGPEETSKDAAPDAPSVQPAQ